MSDVRTILERGVGGATPPPDGFERMLRRRDRKRRNQRVAAGVLGIAVFALAAIGFVRLLGSESTPADKGEERPTPPDQASEILWPQTSLEEVRQAQELADAGDPRYTWQVDPGLEMERVFALSKFPYDAEIFARFLREELGWEEFREIAGFDFGEGYSNVDYFGEGYSNVDFIRCAPGRTNPVYPNDPSGGGCAPTLDGFRYETVRIDVAQPGQKGATGIWVVSRWEMIEPSAQVVPPSEAETTALLEAFLQARIDGEGAGEYVDAHAPWWDEYPFLYGGDEIPFLYATPTGAPYERSEFEVAEGPLWPDGRMRFEVRLFAENGQTVVEQFFQMDGVDRGLWYEDQSDGSDGPGTTVNGQDVPVPYSVFDGEMTLSMAYPWHAEFSDDEGSRFNLVSDEFEGALQLLGPGPVTNGCQQGPTPADAQALARSIRSNPDLEATAPVTVSVGGIPALQMDVTTALSTCPSGAPPKVAEVEVYAGLRSLASCGPCAQIRLYLLDLPQGSSARILAIAFIAPEDRFDAVLEAATPIVGSIEFHAAR